MPKDCGHHKEDKCCSWSCKDLFRCKCDCKGKRRLWWLLAGFIFVFLLIIFIVYLVLLPTKPVFILSDARVVHLNVTGLRTLSSSLQVTLESRNPNNRIGIYYDSLSIYAVFLNQQVTQAESLQPIYQGENSIRVWSQLIEGVDVSVAPYVADSLRKNGVPPYGTFSIEVDGRIGWKVGTWRSGHYGIHVECNAYISCNVVVSSSGASVVYPCHTNVWSQP